MPAPHASCRSSAPTHALRSPERARADGAPPRATRPRPPRLAPPRPALRRGRRARALAAATLYAVTALMIAAPGGATLPPCDAAEVRRALGAALETIPALAGRGARLRALHAPRERGHAGRLPLRACQARLATTAGDGSLEYSIRARGRDARPAPLGAATDPLARAAGPASPTFSVRAELFRGRWHAPRERR